MSVESEILRIQHNIANTYAAVSEKGGEVPLQPTSASLAAAVASIPAASDIEAGSGLSKNGNILSVDLPTEAITRAEYEALTEEERQADVLLIVDEPEWSPTTISVQEYDTEDGWHVRKWSDGYVEMLYKKTHVISKWGTAANVPGVYANVTLPSAFPVKLVKTYAEFASATKETGDSAILKHGCYNKSRYLLNIFQNSSDSSTWTVYLYVTGRWK